MKKILTIDCDIIMHPSINLYNDYDGTATEFYDEFTFLNLPPADLELYSKIIHFLKENKDKVEIIEDHDEIIEKTKIEGPFELINIDHHHDVGYERVLVYGKLKSSDINVGNWVKRLWDLNRITKYTWYRDNNSDLSTLSTSAQKKYLSEIHFVDDLDFSSFGDLEKIYVSISNEWIPEYYKPLIDIIKDI